MFSFRKSTAVHETRSNCMGILNHSVKVIIWVTKQINLSGIKTEMLRLMTPVDIILRCPSC